MSGVVLSRCQAGTGAVSQKMAVRVPRRTPGEVSVFGWHQILRAAVLRDVLGVFRAHQHHRGRLAGRTPHAALEARGPVRKRARAGRTAGRPTALEEKAIGRRHLQGRRGGFAGKSTRFGGPVTCRKERPAGFRPQAILSIRTILACVGAAVGPGERKNGPRRPLGP